MCWTRYRFYWQNVFHFKSSAFNPISTVVLQWFGFSVLNFLSILSDFLSLEKLGKKTRAKSWAICKTSILEWWKGPKDQFWQVPNICLQVIYNSSALGFSYFFKVEKIWEDSLDLIPSPSAKIQIISGKVYLR